MKILIDCDNILNNLAEVVLKTYNEDWNDNLKIDDIVKYQIENFVKEPAKENFYKYFIQKRVWKQISSITDSIKYINKLREDGHELYLCTKTEPYNAYKKSEWCFRNYGFKPRKNFLCVPDKTMVRGDILIDDCTANFGGQKCSIALAYPWNEDFKADGITNFRCNSWKDIYDTIVSIDEINDMEYYYEGRP